MAVIDKHQPGMFCWPELATTDAAAAKRFYGGLFGWEWNDMDMGGGMTYTMIRFKDKDVGALYSMPPQMRQQGVPPHWLLYVSVEDAAATMDKAKALGAKILFGPHVVGESGSAGCFQDPQGAAIGVWQPNKQIGSSIMREPGTLGWSELATPDRVAARDFYTKVFGWGTKISQMGPIEYTEWKAGDASTGGMLEMAGEAWRGIPPHWMPYFEVSDCNGAVTKVKELGGDVKVPPTPIPNIGTFAVVSDGQDAVFYIIQMQRG